MNRFQFRFLSVVLCAGVCLPVISQSHSTQSTAADVDAERVKKTLRGVPLGEWTFNGFQAVQSTDPKGAPWAPFINRSDGYAAIFINRHKDIPNTGKGGAAQGTRHPEFALWIFRMAGPNTVQNFEATINQHQMMQTSIPVVLGANHDYVLVGVGDLDEGESQVVALARAMAIPLDRGR